MNLIIHRGTREIGGNCIEIASKKTRILVDFGLPLVTAEQRPFDSKSLEGKSINSLQSEGILPKIKGLYQNNTRSIDAILVSHSHLDHYGFLRYVHPEIPIYMSKGAHILINISSIFTPAKVGLSNFVITPNRSKLSIGDFTVTPYTVDHSAFDAFAFLIESEGQRIFYSGDFRGHGRKSALFKKIVTNPPKNIDYLLIEGSMIGRNDQSYKTESQVQTKIEEILSGHNHITFIFMSSQNIDRIVSAYKACLKTDSVFVIDLYTAYILDKLREVSNRIPQFNWKNIRVKFYKQHADILAQKISPKILYRYNTKKIELPEINKIQNRVLMLARDNAIFPHIIKGIGDVGGAKIIYSMWEGYLTDKFKDYCDKNNIVIERMHTSGHAFMDDLKSFSKALAPKRLIPIHTFYADRYKELFDNVVGLDDGESLAV